MRGPYYKPKMMMLANIFSTKSQVMRQSDVMAGEDDILIADKSVRPKKQQHGWSLGTDVRQ